MKNEFHVLGPPGTGKTTYLAKQIENAAAKHGAENVIVASYTKTAATELNRRNLPIPRENVGTLHALCYRALKNYNYEIAEVKAQEFNEQYPGSAITINSKSPMDEMAVDAVFGTAGDEHLNEYNLFRAKCLPLHLMKRPTIFWVKQWEKWKSENNYIDFTDMITLTASMNEPFPGEPKVGIYDEVQDFNRLELQLIRHWSKFQDHIILGGDDDQTIYDFCGASPDAFIDVNIPAENNRVLQRSWRLPKVVHEFSQKWIKQIKKREIKEFYPREEEGSIQHIKATYRTPEMAIELAERHARDGKTVMILASCGFFLKHVQKQLREAGLPFHNPYRATRGDWNPMGSFHRGQGGRTSTRERILSFLDEISGKPNNGYWNAKDLLKWMELVKVSDVLKRGAKDKIQSVIEENKGVIFNEKEFYAEIFKEFALQQAMQRDVTWFRNVLLASKLNAVEYPLKVYEKQGREALEARPKITIGTVHSVKGGEASTVILFPDLSVAAMEEYQTNKDSIIRTFYVGMTRAKESLVICQPNSSLSVKLD